MTRYRCQQNPQLLFQIFSFILNFQRKSKSTYHVTKVLCVVGVSVTKVLCVVGVSVTKVLCVVGVSVLKQRVPICYNRSVINLQQGQDTCFPN